MEYTGTKRHIRNDSALSSSLPPNLEDNVTSSSSASSSDLHQRTGYRLQAAMLASIIPLLLVIMTTIFISLRLHVHHRSVNELRAQVACNWIAQHLSNQPSNSWPTTLELFREKTDLLLEIQNSDAVIPPNSLLSQLTPAAMIEITAGNNAWINISNRNHVFSSVPVQPGSKWLLFAGAPTQTFMIRLLNVAGRLIWIGFVLISVAAVFGFVFGETLHTYLQGLGNRLETMSTLENETLRPTNYSSKAATDQTPLAQAIIRLEQRFRGDFALHRDALDEIRVMDAQRSQFLGSVSLELSFPLEAIIARAHKLLEGDFGPLSKSQQEDMQIIKQAGQRLLDMVNEIRDLSSLTTDGIKFDSDPVNLTIIAEEVVNTTRGQAQDKDLTISLDIESPPPPVKANRRRIWQIITNLVSNAVKFTDKGSVKVVLGKTESGDAYIDVRDTGTGIPSGAHKAIFDPFRQAGEKSKRRRGTGLGLALCKGLVELHNGKIELESTMGEGSCFRVILPGIQ